MKYVLSALVAAAVLNPVSAFAIDYTKFSPASTCGLPYDTNELFELVGVQAQQRKDLTSGTRVDLNLSRQIVEVVSYTNGTHAEYYGARREMIKQDGYSQKFEKGGVSYDLVAYYPGDNEYGLIFLSGTDEVVAAVADSEIYCK